MINKQTIIAFALGVAATLLVLRSAVKSFQ